MHLLYARVTYKPLDAIGSDIGNQPGMKFPTRPSVHPMFYALHDHSTSEIGNHKRAFLFEFVGVSVAFELKLCIFIAI